jgi:hypothetical protein
LARVAGVSPKTVVQLEETGIARWDAVARIARSLDQPVQEWLKIAGHKIPMSRIEDLLRKRPAAAVLAFPRVDPADYYQRVVDRLKIHHSALMCTCVLSNAPLATEALYQQMKDVLSAGLHFALVCPFPRGDPNFAGTKPRLNQYYSNTYTWTCILAERLRTIMPSLKNRIHVFAPKTYDEGTPLVWTPIRANELRPSFTKYSASDKAGVKYEFGAYIRFLDGKSDSWIDIFSGEGQASSRAEEAYGPWFDYCFDICNAWTVENGNSQYDTDKLGAWELMAR